jgi:hypothetical protein
MSSVYGQDRVVVFGGYKIAAEFLNDTWIYDYSKNSWTLSTPSISPGIRVHHDIASIHGTNKILLHGGIYNFSWHYGDTWVYNVNNNKWSTKKYSINPGSRGGYAISSVYGSKAVLLHSGTNSTIYFNDTWAYELKSYVEKGTFISCPFNIDVSATYKKISWDGITSINTSIKLQIRSADSKKNLISKKFVGPNGSADNYYNISPSNIWQENISDNWIQYKVYLSTKNESETPILKNVTISYNNWPKVTLVSPQNETYISKNKPLFKWKFEDK